MALDDSQVSSPLALRALRVYPTRGVGQLHKGHCDWAAGVCVSLNVLMVQHTGRPR